MQKKSRDSLDYHRILDIRFEGGFLDDVHLTFDNGLNCLIGGRGTGKTTVLEMLRYALNQMPDPHQSRYHRDLSARLEKLLESNLRDGRISITIQTENGSQYAVTRHFGETPIITDSAGQEVQFDIGKGIVFDADIYSQNAIEHIAENSYFQLELIDKFIAEDIRDITSKLRAKVKELESNASDILDTRKSIADLDESIRELPDITERVRDLEAGSNDREDENLRREHERKALRSKETQLTDAIADVYSTGLGRLDSLLQQLKQPAHAATALDTESSPNTSLLHRIREVTQVALEGFESHILAAKQSLLSARRDLRELDSELRSCHAQQDRAYRDLMDKHSSERVKESERAKLLQRQEELQGKQKLLREKEKHLRELSTARENLLADLSALRDRRYKIRQNQAEALNKDLSPMIRIRIEQFGNLDEYRNLLVQAMRGSRIRYNAIVDRAVEHIPPTELASLIQSDDRVALEKGLDLRPDQATRMIIQLKDTPSIFAIETVELHDRPIIELRDGPDYKDSTSLSTGQKCTTILPILLAESKRPLLIDQPEDNLDNAFIFDTIVQYIKEIKGRRQLIFATHNPNIPVLGDAGRVFVLQSTGRSACVMKAGSVNDSAEEIMRILEGGKDAFKARWDRYDLPPPTVTTDEDKR